MTATLNAAKPWPADHVERRAIASLVPYARNARTHSDAQVDQLAKSITEWGWTVPVLVDEDGTIIAGHGRVLAAQKLGLDDVPVMVASGWTDAQKRAYVIADNKIALNSDWDFKTLLAEITDLRSIGVDLDVAGFHRAELATLLDGVEWSREELDRQFGGMPVNGSQDAFAARSIKVHFKTHEDVERFAELLGQTISDATRWVWFPKTGPALTMHQRVISDVVPEPLPDLHREQGEVEQRQDDEGARSDQRALSRRRRAPRAG